MARSVLGFGAVAEHRILFYEYVEQMAERRAPHREAHLAHIGREHDAGRLVMAGALGDPPHGGALVFRDTSESEIETFVTSDPYVDAGLVTGWRIELWNVVT
jgi:uncharacterized protein YciI